MRLHTYARVWYLGAAAALQEAFIFRGATALFFLGKVVRLGTVLLVLATLHREHISLGSYSSDATIMFFLTYQVLDVATQMVFRGVYGFGRLIRTGNLDTYLSKPISPLFRSLLGAPDFDDALFLLPVLALTVWLMSTLQLNFTLTSVLWYIFLLCNGFVIATSFHILVLVAGIFTSDVDNLVWTYRDVSRLAQFPISLYSQPLRGLLTFVVPMGIMFSVPTQVLLGEEPLVSIPLAVVISGGLLFTSLRLWGWGLREYSGTGS
jgi:ABC-2 type transport system permease protein